MSNNAHIENTGYPLNLKDVQEPITGAQVKSITPHNEQTVKEAARRQAEEMLGMSRFGGRGLIGILSNFLGTVVNGIAGAILGGGGSDFAPINDAMAKQRLQQQIEVAEKQSKLADSIDKAQFYGCTWRANNVNSGGGGSPFMASNTRWAYLALDRNTGPLKGCHISDRGLLILDRKGLWEIKVKVKGYSKESKHKRMMYTYAVEPGYSPPKGLQSSYSAYGTPFAWSDASYEVIERNGILYNQPTDLSMVHVDTFYVNIPSPGYGLMIIFSGMEVVAGPSTTVLTASLMDTSVLTEWKNNG